MTDASLIAYALRFGDLSSLQRAGISQEHFVDEWQTAWRYLLRQKRDFDAVPSADTFSARFPDLDLPRVRKTELPMLVHQAKQRRKYIDLLLALQRAGDTAVDYESVEDVISALQGELNTLAYRDSTKSHMVDLFSKRTQRQIRNEIRAIRRGVNPGIPTGLKRFDEMRGGLQRQRLATIIGRPGLGKSWLDLLFVKSAVLAGKSVILYPLEMPVFETAARLYTLFSHDLLGSDRVIKNLDITRGKVSMQKLTRLMGLLEDRFPGALHVADSSVLSDPYTTERIEAEVDAYRPDMFWVDYLTLLHVPRNGQDNESSGIRTLTRGLKNTCMRRNVVGGVSAQVNREALKARQFLPRLEHIAYGDSIGQDSDDVFSINRSGQYLYYAVVKCRGAPEIAKTRVTFMVNKGRIAETEDQDDDD